MSDLAKAGPSSPTVHGVPIPLLMMSLDLGNGQQDLLPIYSASSPSDLAEKLGQKHKLKKPLVRRLETLIKRKKQAASKFVTSHGNISTLLTTTRQSVTETTPRKVRSQSELKPFSPIKSRPMNYGEWMYQRGKQFQGKLRYDQMRKAASQQHLCTTERQKLRKNEKPEIELMKKAEETQIKIKNQRSEAMEKEMSECTFKPAINERSAKLDRCSSVSFHGAQRFDKLFSDAYDKEIRQLDRHEVAVKTEFSFHPTVSSVRKTSESQSEMISRLASSKKNFSEVIDKLKSELDENGGRSASASGFKPMTGRGPIWTQYARKGPVHEHLYNQRTKRQTLVQRLRKQEELWRGAPARLSIPKSEEIVQDSRRRLIRELFAQLDQNGDGFLDFKSLTLQEMDNRSMLILSPIYAELQESGEKMNLEGFEKKMSELLADISNEEKTYLLHAVAVVGRVKETQASEMKHSVLSKTSEELARESFSALSIVGEMANKRKQQLGGDVYARRVVEKLETAKKLQEMREDKEREELSSCTFHPAVINYKRKAQAASSLSLRVTLSNTKRRQLHSIGLKQGGKT